MAKEVLLDKEFEISGEIWTLRRIIERTGDDSKTVSDRIMYGFTIQQILDPELLKAERIRRKKDRKRKDYEECIGTKSGTLTAIEVVEIEDGFRLVAECECGNKTTFQGPSKFKISRSCKNKSCTDKSRSMMKEANGTARRPRINVEEKRCPNCEFVKPRSEFYTAGKRSSTGLQSYCKECFKYMPSKSIDYSRDYREANKDKMHEIARAYAQNRRDTDPGYRLRCALGTRLRSAVRKEYKSAKTMDLLGCDRQFLVKHLESQFEPEMTWENYGKEWQVDHIKPCAKFDLTDYEQQKICFHYANLQPLWSTTEIAKRHGSTKIGNRNKADRYEEVFEDSEDDTLEF